TSGAALKLMILDACRNNPLPKSASRGATRGLARLKANTAGTMITFATAPGDVAADGDTQNSPFTAALVQHITTPGLEIRQLMGRVRETVYKSTGKRQLPWVNEALIGEFYFAGKDPNAKPVPVAEPKAIAVVKAEPDATGPTEKEAFVLAQSLGTTDAWDAFLTQFPNGPYAGFAAAARAKLVAPPASQQQTAAVEPQQNKPAASGGFLFPYSGEQRISPGDLEGLSKQQLRIARNEIFARRGRHFKSADLRRHFKRFGWYKPHTWKPKLNRIEKANVNLIKNTEKWR
ncbi:MAG: YARHG domain-containing protein, partial [Rhizobiales bacterium]|nr:YARHG domain-containing protein [Hyphomicrobiales bacterium]